MVIQMRKLIIALLILTAVESFTAADGTAERIYHWTDSSGVTHLTQHPPPADGQLNDVMDYSNSDRIPGNSTEWRHHRRNRDEIEEPTLADDDAYRRDEIEQAVSEDNYCYLQAPDIDVYVRVWEPDSYGDRGAKLWSGLIPKSQQQKIASPNGRVIYDYQEEYRGPFGGQKSANCSGGGIIQILR